ncbi:hypothetical protein PsAD2_02785 [Pseudovibrio axinellae]|uniref:Uncharacterized protein n=1 Tax=Pseudovibrio axinellae TaxID=989403 RepID=A0A165XUD7_9HYPH|nr:hypothetical protein PsAD2_02785 [Pseudovibrio axinellae]SER12130.1 hypothetical protein SAMN05421798_106195 [Pseudovibrio axinellae]
MATVKQDRVMKNAHFTTPVAPAERGAPVPQSDDRSGVQWKLVKVDDLRCRAQKSLHHEVGYHEGQSLEFQALAYALHQ